MGAPIFHVLSKLFLTATAFHTLVLEPEYTNESDISRQRWSFEQEGSLYYICNDYYGSCIGVLGNETVKHAQVALYQRDLGYCKKTWNLKSFGNTTITLENTKMAIDLVEGEIKSKLLWLFPTDHPINNHLNNLFEVVYEKNS